MHHDDWFGNMLLGMVMLLILATTFGIPALFYYHYTLESQCVRSNNIKSTECFELFVRTGKTVNLNTHAWDK